MNDLPPPLPPCTEVVLSMQEAFQEWAPIGTLKNLGVEVYAYKIEDTGQGATYTKVMYTPSRTDVVWALKTGWRLIKEATCTRDGGTIYSLIMTTEVKEKV